MAPSSCWNQRYMDYIEGDDDTLENASRMSNNWLSDGQLMAYRHPGFWQCMDTMREKQILNDYWDSGDAPWKLWKGEAK